MAVLCDDEPEILQYFSVICPQFCKEMEQCDSIIGVKVTGHNFMDPVLNVLNRLIHELYCCIEKQVKQNIAELQ